MRPDLTPRMREIARLISLGCSGKEIGDILGISPSTVDNHRTRIMHALGTDKAALITRLALKHRVTSMKDKLTLSEKRKCGRKRDGWN